MAAAAGDLGTVRRLLEEGTAVDSSTTWEETEERAYGSNKSWTWQADTALCAAVRNGHTAVVQLLLDAGASTSVRVCNRCDVHETPLSIAAAVSADFHDCSHLL